VARVWPLVAATMTSQASLVVLAPAIAAVGEDFTAPVAAVGQARTVTAAVAVAASLAITARITAIGVPRLLAAGSVVTLAACAAVASAPHLAGFLAAHVLVGVGLACHLTAGFAGVAAFGPGERARAVGRVAGANALAWILVNPLAGGLTQWASWRAAYAVPAGLAVVTMLAARATTRVPETGAALPVRALLAGPAGRWIAAELLAYTCWTGLLTFVGAFFVQWLGVREAVAGWFLAAGAAAYFLASAHSGGLVARASRRLLVAGPALAMAGLLPALLSVGPTGTAAALSLFCLIGLMAGVRTPAASSLGLDQLPGQAQAMMAVRTAVTQLGYLFGAVGSGAVIAASGYLVLGVVLGAGMGVSALLALRVPDRAPAPA
jgi:predicted MFS family arabinose efflux permease